MSESKVVDEYMTYCVAHKWFDALSRGDAEVIASCLDENVEFINYTKIEGMNDVMPWIGTYHGIENVMKSLQTFLGVADVKLEELVALIVNGENAVGIVHEISTIKATQKDFEIEFIQCLKIQSGKIVRWKSYTDPSSIILAMRTE
ncbi:MAG: nuclear transport factor 2 family protein [Methylococcales bacterium]